MRKWQRLIADLHATEGAFEALDGSRVRCSYAEAIFSGHCLIATGKPPGAKYIGEAVGYDVSRETLKRARREIQKSTSQPSTTAASDLARASQPTPPPAPAIVGTGADTSGDIAAIRAESHRRYQQKARRAETKSRQTVTFPHGPVFLAFVGDQHFGNAGADTERAYRERDLILKTPGAYAWMMGDIVDNFIVGKLMAQNMKPSTPVWEQWVLAQDYLAGFSERLVAVVGGNHGAWTQMLTGIDYRRDITPAGVLYDGDEIRAEVRVGAHTFRVWTRHQWRGSSIYNQTHGQERAARFADPAYDFYVGAHTHTGAVCREFIHEGRRKAAIQIGAYKRFDDYALRLGFPAADGSTACGVVLYDDGAWFPMSNLTAAHRYMNAIYS